MALSPGSQATATFSIEGLASILGIIQKYVRLEFDLHRLSSTFACGWSGTWRLLLRLLAGGCLVLTALARLNAGQSLAVAALDLVALGGGILLMMGMWTSAAGALMAALAVWSFLAHQVDLYSGIVLVILGTALAFVGPGAWSLDARMYGWMKLESKD